MHTNLLSDILNKLMIDLLLQFGGNKSLLRIACAPLRFHQRVPALLDLRVAMCFSVLQCVAVCCSVLQCVAF